jgi:predicted nucleotidyltransferase
VLVQIVEREIGNRMDKKISEVLSELRVAFEALYGERLVRMVLFGSQARADAEEGSDIDVLVVLKGPVDSGEEIARTGTIVADLSLRFNEVICCVFMDDSRFSSRNGPLLRNIRKEGVAV